MVRTATLALVGGLVIAGVFVALMIPRGICGSDGAYVELQRVDPSQYATPVQDLTASDFANLTTLRQLVDTFVTHRQDANASWFSNTTMHYDVSPDESRAIRDFFRDHGPNGSDTIFRYEGVTFRAEAGQVVC